MSQFKLTYSKKMTNLQNKNGLTKNFCVLHIQLNTTIFHLAVQ